MSRRRHHKSFVCVAGRTYVQENLSVLSTQHVRLDPSVSCFIDQALPPVLDNPSPSKVECFIVINTPREYLQRFVATQKLYHSTHNRLDFVVVEIGDMIDAAVLAALQCSVCFVKCSLFLKYLYCKNRKGSDDGGFDSAEFHVKKTSLATKDFVICSGLKYCVKR